MTFGIGLAAVSFSRQMTSHLEFYDVTQEELADAVFVIKPPFFIATGRGCGNGYVQGYESSDGQWLSEGVTPMSLKEFKKEIGKISVINRADKGLNRFGEKGVKHIVKENGDDGKEYFGIWWYGHGGLHYIEAPTLELVLEFERANAYAY